MEWHSGASFKGPQGKTAVIQICDDKRILIIQVSAMSDFPSKLRNILESPHVVKMGIGVLGDGHKLRRDFGIIANGLLELGSFVNLVDPPFKKSMISLKNAVERYTGYTLLKGVFEKSDWEAILSSEQLEYAANDAHAALFVFTALLERARAQGLVVKPVIVPNSLGMGITYIED
ncbi:ribonuclease H-like domain-containing protein [Hysterangium stoloniferum]|nr:ribonuclease H-like domain-containing protein [Hysterangium stoloniferum]